MCPPGVFFGLYKYAAILHFSVSTLPAELQRCDCGGSGRGLSADARPHIFLDFFPISRVVFTPQDPSGRTFCVDKGMLHHLNCRLCSVSPSLLVGLFRKCQQEWRRLLCAPAGDAAAAAAAAAAASEPVAFSADMWDTLATTEWELSYFTDDTRRLNTCFSA